MLFKNINNKTSLDFITVGRAGIDFYAQEENKNFPQINNYAIGVGGSPANIAVGLSRLGSRVGIITKLSQDGLEKFILTYFKKNKVNLQGISYDPKAKLSLAITEIKPKNGRVVFYRENPVDLQLTENDIKAEYIKKAKAVILTGTSLAKNPSRRAIKKIIQIANHNNIKIVFDLDYRASNWKSLDDTKKVYREICCHSDLIIGNLVEFKFIKDNLKWGKAKEKDFNQWLKLRSGLIILKNGEKGAKVFSNQDKEVPSAGIWIKPFRVKAKKPFGAGDAFLSTFLNKNLSGAGLKEALEWASAAAALVVGRPSCSEAMPSPQEIISFIEKNTK